jgi:hypothetical protein
MTMTIDDTINRQTYGPIGYLLSRQTFWVFAAAVVAFVYVSFASPSFFTPGNLFNIVRNFAFVGIISLGMTAVIITGGIDLSVGSVLCLTGMVVGMMMNADYSIWVALPAGLAVAALAGGISGVLIAYIGMPPFVVTLGMMSLARSVAMVMSNNTMVFDFGRDHSSSSGSAAARPEVGSRNLPNGSAWTAGSAASSPGLRRASPYRTHRSFWRPSRCSSASHSVGPNGAATSSPSAATSRRQQ